MLAFTLQAIIVLAVSGLCIAFLGAIYFVIGALIAITVFAILVGHGRWASEDPDLIRRDSLDDRHGLPLEFFYRLMLGALLGVMWPSLPIILWRGSARDRAKRLDADARARSNGR